MLRILGQRDDGYHQLQTYFQLLDWGDSMQFSTLKEDKIKIFGDFNNLAIENNLIYHALELLLPYKKANIGIQINVDKYIPQGSGLGGGSSNAATTLLMMNKLWNCELSNKQLQNKGLKLGADVPIFILNQSAIAEGVGELLTPIK
jgi:4-diphosphocytidyl-2-C-methyl-D-erythritol kinase